MTPRRPINLRGYQVFEAIARTGSLTDAGRELGVIQSAVSHQLRHLRERYEDRLLERRGGNLVLTDKGKRLFDALASAFAIIEQQANLPRDMREGVRLGIYSSFGQAWLIPRLPQLLDECPESDLRLVMLYDPHEVGMEIADLYVTSEPRQVGYVARRLAPDRLVPMTHPDGPADFTTSMPLITSEGEPGIAVRRWESFAALNGLDLSRIRSTEWICSSHYIFSLEMAASGIGVAPIPDFMADYAIGQGRLKRLPGKALPTGEAYGIQFPRSRQQDPAWYPSPTCSPRPTVTDASEGGSSMRVHLDGLPKEFGTTRALHPVDLSIPSGALVALLGPPGPARRRYWASRGGL